MKLTQSLFILFSFLATIYAIALPASFDSFSESATELFKRKGGGGGGGRGGGGSSSGGTSSGGSRGGGSSSGGSSSGSSRTSPSSNTGGSTSAGSGTTRGFSNGQYYGGGASMPYAAGQSTRSITPYPLVAGAALGVLPGLWLYGAWAYAWPHGPYGWHNTTNNQNETGPVECLCGQYSACGCDENNSTDYLTSVANNGSIAQRSSNGTLYINGTLENGTTAPGGTDAASGLKGNIIQMPGLALLVAGVVFTVYC